MALEIILTAEIVLVLIIVALMAIRLFATKRVQDRVTRAIDHYVLHRRAHS
jgi:multisubunit Na+/H+ antiporter MnhF subunit